MTWYDIWWFKDLPRKTASDKLLCDKAFDIAKTPSVIDIKKVLLQESTGTNTFVTGADAGGVVTRADKSTIKKKYVKPKISRRITQTNYYKI